MVEVGDFPEFKKKKWVKKLTTSMMYSHPAGKSDVAVTGEDWLGILNFQLLMPHTDIFKNYW